MIIKDSRGICMTRGTYVQRHKQKKKEMDDTLHAVQAVKMVSMLALRNQGYGQIRLRRFSEEFNNIIYDVSHGRLSLSDIPDTIYDETGLSIKDMGLGE